MTSFFARLIGADARAPAPQNQTQTHIHAKATRTGALLLQRFGLARWAPRPTGDLVRHGFERNAVVYRAVRMVAESAATIPWLVYENGLESEGHPLLPLLARPNPGQAGAQFLETLFTNLMLFGNAYVERVEIDGVLRELHALRPDRVTVTPGRNGWPAAYEYAVGADKVRFEVEPDGRSPILHLKLFHPLDDHYGFAPISAAQTPIEVHNAASQWNKALLDNAARPSGALVYAGPDGASLSDDQFDRLKSELDENFAGPRNAGRPLLLEGGLDWKPLSLTPKDMDFIEAKAAAARDIALAFGVPPQVLGLPGDNTYSNYQEANRAFWRQTVIPLVRRTQQDVAAWLRDTFGPIAIESDLDRIDALASERETEWRRIGAANFLTDDEKREAVGYKPKAKKACGCSPRKKYREDQARGPDGRWVDEGLAPVSPEPTGELALRLDDECEQEWKEAIERCYDLIFGPNPNPKLAGGYTDPLLCAKGFVSMRCGGNPV